MNKFCITELYKTILEVQTLPFQQKKKQLKICLYVKKATPYVFL